jgi:hypothetical protein
MRLSRLNMSSEYIPDARIEGPFKGSLSKQDGCILSKKRANALMHERSLTTYDPYDSSAVFTY